LLCRGIRGATKVAANTRQDILTGADELLRKMVEANQVEVDKIAAVFFTTSNDLNAEFPALAARRLGWTSVPLLCGHEMNVPGSMPLCIRVMMMYNTDKTPREIVHVYLREARALRPELEPVE
jgi:chorismate mutase